MPVRNFGAFPDCHVLSCGSRQLCPTTVTLSPECHAALGWATPRTISELTRSLEEWTAGIVAFAVVSKHPNPLQKCGSEVIRAPDSNAASYVETTLLPRWRRQLTNVRSHASVHFCLPLVPGVPDMTAKTCPWGPERGAPSGSTSYGAKDSRGLRVRSTPSRLPPTSSRPWSPTSPLLWWDPHFSCLGTGQLVSGSAGKPKVARHFYEKTRTCFFDCRQPPDS